jgi:GntR family transcriptional repressor for pyruvate dehydrogenase complex
LTADNTIASATRVLSLTEKVARGINDWIVAQELQPGDALPSEQELIQRFRVARSVVREALMRLRALGVVEVRRGLGTFVADMPVGLLQARLRRLGQDAGQGLRHLIELHRLLLADAAELAASRAQRGEVERLLEAVAEIEAAGKAAGDRLDAFHVLLAQASGNLVLEQLLAGALPMLRGAERQPPIGSPTAMANSLRRLVEAIAASRPEAARTAALELFATAVESRPAREPC